MGYGIWPLLYWRAKYGALVRALASHQCGPGSNPGVDAICELSLLLVLSFSLRGFSPGTLVFPSPQRPTFSHALSPNHIYLFIYLLKFTRETRLTKILTWIRILYTNRSSGCGVVMTPPPPGPVHSKHWNLPELISSINISCYHCLININSMDSKTLNHNCYIFFIQKKIPHSPSLPFSDTQ